MDKARYLVELEKLLSTLSSDERDDALEFYDEFIADADLKTRAEIEAKLGTPEQLSQKIINDYSDKKPNSAEEKSFWTVKKVVLIVILVLLLGPILFALICSILGIVIGVVIAILAVLISAIGVCALTVYSGLYLLFSAPFVGCFYLGISFLAAASLLLLVPLFCWLGRWSFKLLRNLWIFVKQKVQMVWN